MMKLTWLGHSCFRVECQGYTLVIDPFEPGSVPGCGDIHEEADAVLCSHEHHDHNCRAAVSVTSEGKPCPVKITELHAYHDDQQGALRGANTIHILEGDGVKVAHMGDIGCMPAPEQLEALQNCDAVMIPVGGHYTVGPQEAKAIVDAIQPRVVIPMHYRSSSFGFEVLGTLEEYLDICGRWVRYGGAEIEITPNMTRHTAVLQYKG